MYEVIIFGNASQKMVTTLQFKEEDLGKNLMDFLRENGLPIASSCGGKKQCKKCVINGFLLSCSVTLQDYLRISSQPIDARGVPNKFLVTIDYL